MRNEVSDGGFVGFPKMHVPLPSSGPHQFAYECVFDQFRRKFSFDIPYGTTLTFTAANLDAGSSCTAAAESW